MLQKSMLTILDRTHPFAQALGGDIRDFPYDIGEAEVISTTS